MRCGGPPRSSDARCTAGFPPLSSLACVAISGPTWTVYGCGNDELGLFVASMGGQLTRGVHQRLVKISIAPKLPSWPKWQRVNHEGVFTQVVVNLGLFIEKYLEVANRM